MDDLYDLPPLEKARALLEQGSAARREGRDDLAHGFYTQSMHLFRGHGDRHGTASALVEMVDLALHYNPTDQDSFERRKTLAEQALAIFRELGDDRGMGRSLRVLASVVPHDEGSRLLEESLAPARKEDSRIVRSCTHWANWSDSSRVSSRTERLPNRQWRWGMTVNGLQLPEAFAALIDRPQPIDWWVPKGGSDRWVFRGGEGGVYWAPEGTPDRHDYLDGLELIRNLETVVEKTNLLPSEFSVDYYTPEEIAEQNAANALLPGSIPFITDFSKIVQFGYAGDGAAYCFDFRENPDEPSIVHWNDGYWRRVAPNFQYFIDLFEPLDRDKALLESVRTTNTAELRDWLRFVDEKIASGQLQESTQADFERQSHLIRQELHRRAGEER